MSISLYVSAAIFILIAVRQWLPETVRIWHIMTLGAITLLLLGQISPTRAFESIDWTLIIYLFSVFSIASALYDAGVSRGISQYLLAFRTPFLSLLVYTLIMAVCAAVLTNDAAAVIGVPIAIMMARKMRWGIVPLLILLCAAVTTGSMITPVGNPQNILIANFGSFSNMFLVFGEWIIVPAILTMVIAIWWLKRFLTLTNEEEIEEVALYEDQGDVKRRWPSIFSGILLFGLIVLGSILHEGGWGYEPSIAEIGLVACLPIYLASNERLRVLKEVDWPTLLFFIAMFVVTGSLLDSGSLQYLLGGLQQRLDEPQIVAVVSFFASQLFSNVPVVEIYLNLLKEHTTATLMMLSAISTASGNLFIISAASNVIVVQQAEKFGVKPFSFWQFTLWMLPVTVASVLLSYFWINWFATTPFVAQ
ncbi:SLC13 family permease [Flexibacterium corallicola]|uniref:SLC13 family permease n=1 Tax=Flexibacterium corallicola TaxID=3037259 RepID=UPI00286F5F8A|nr:SLC13 family permease [Pseudovibrio sp. M1P-2-3]